MTNSIENLDKQVLEIGKHIADLETNIIHLSNYIDKSISHSEYIKYLDWVIIVVGLGISLFALIAAVLVGYSVSKIFSQTKDENRVKNELKSYINECINQSYKEIEDRIQELLSKIEEKYHPPYHNEDSDKNLFDLNDDEIQF